MICVPESDPGWSALESMDDLPEPMRQEVEHFFSVSTDLEQKHVEVHGWDSRDQALDVIEDGRRRYVEGSEASR